MAASECLWTRITKASLVRENRLFSHSLRVQTFLWFFDKFFANSKLLLYFLEMETHTRETLESWSLTKHEDQGSISCNRLSATSWIHNKSLIFLQFSLQSSWSWTSSENGAQNESNKEKVKVTWCSVVHEYNHCMVYVELFDVMKVSYEIDLRRESFFPSKLPLIILILLFPTQRSFSTLLKMLSWNILAEKYQFLSQDLQTGSMYNFPVLLII